MKALFGGVYAPSTIGTLLREFSFGHARQLESVLRQHLSALCDRVDLLPGADVGVFIDIDSLLRPVYGHAKQGASYGHTKIAGKQVLRKGLSPLAATISTDTAAPVIAGMRLRAGKSGSGKGAARMVAQAIATARAAGVTGQILVRGDSAYGTAAVVAACRRAGARFSLVLTKNPAVAAAIDAIAADAWTPVRYPGAVRDPDTGAWISDAEVAEISYTAFASTRQPVTARLIVRRVKDARYPDALFPVWRYHPFFTDSTEPVTEADDGCRLTRLRWQQRVHGVAVQKVIQRRVGEFPAVCAINRVVIESGSRELTPHQRFVVGMLKGIRAEVRQHVVRVRSGCANRYQRRGLPLALCQRQHLVAVTIGDASLIENRHAVVQAFQAFRFGRQAVKLRVTYRDMQPLFEYLAAARQLVIELDHAAGDVEHDSGLARSSTATTHTTAPSPPRNSLYRP